jgi:hypothetical protein
LIYQHQARDADQAITDAIDRHVQAEQRADEDADGTAGVLARWANGTEDQQGSAMRLAHTQDRCPDLG